MVEAAGVELLARRQTERLAALVRDQPPAFWDAISAKLDAAPDGTITMDDVMEALRERQLDE
ncbi:hypothetical protein [Rhizobium johnstonii]|uniref:hypothetical protein n=1 Tax=Rhizobium johnstonii TaxID=3019933 RepID=UPI003F9A64B9